MAEFIELIGSGSAAAPWIASVVVALAALKVAHQALKLGRDAVRAKDRKDGQ